jgi:aryl-alcohol dehydrogenase-like predicted oxidoreductase
LATKYSQCTAAGFPNHAGNGRKNMMRAIDDSLRRLRTDHVDLYILHLWDRHTPAEEVIHTFDDLVRAGKVRYAGMSDVPAWYAARAQTYAEAHGLTPITSLQLPYSLIERSLEPEFPSLALTLGMGITAWSPLGMGMLSGKYLEGRQGVEGHGRLTSTATSNILGYFSPRNFAIAAVVREVAAQIGRTSAQVAINWVANRPAVNCVIIGASKMEQLTDNLGALDFVLPGDLEVRLDEASRVPWGSPYSMFQNDFQHTAIDAGTTIRGKPSGYYAL